jgi:hypothetical protein
MSRRRVSPAPLSSLYRPPRALPKECLRLLAKKHAWLMLTGPVVYLLTCDMAVYKYQVSPLYGPKCHVGEGVQEAKWQ